MQRTQATVHLDRLEQNIAEIRRRLKPGVELFAVLKGDAYGHGIAGVVPKLQKCGIRHYAAAIWEEGMAIRQAGAAKEPILILGDTWDEQLPQLIRWRLTPTIFSAETAAKLDALAAEAGVIQPIHLAFDTGMSRIGFRDDYMAQVRAIARMEHLRITGAFTHFARADELDRPETNEAFARFCAAIDALRQEGIPIPMLHAANSPSILLRPEVQLDAVRGGDVLYGLCPVDEAIWPRQGLREVLTWETYVAHVKTVPAGTPVGYGGTCVTKRPTVIATIPVGFGDGYNRRLSNRGRVRIRGGEAPILGRVCMDQFMVDVTDIPGVTRGDTVHLLDDKLSILWMADLLEINVDEVVCDITRRVPRVYTDTDE